MSADTASISLYYVHAHKQTNKRKNMLHAHVTSVNVRSTSHLQNQRQSPSLSCHVRGFGTSARFRDWSTSGYTMADTSGSDCWLVDCDTPTATFNLKPLTRKLDMRTMHITARFIETTRLVAKSLSSFTLSSGFDWKSLVPVFPAYRLPLTVFPSCSVTFNKSFGPSLDRA